MERKRAITSCIVTSIAQQSMNLKLLFSCAAFLLLVGCSKEDNDPPAPVPSTPQQGLVDIEGNTYDTVVIGGRTWMAENLRVTRYRKAMPSCTGPTPVNGSSLTEMLGAYTAMTSATAS